MQNKTDLQAWVTIGKERLRSMGVKQWGLVLIAGLCCLVIVFPMGKENDGQKQDNTVQRTEQQNPGTEPGEADYTERMEARLRELLSQVKDVGQVEVMVTVGSTVRKTVLQDGSRESEQITEQDSAGGSRSSVSERSEGTTVFYDIQGDSVPYILSETYPEITGVVVIAQGSGTGTVDLDILNAVQVLFDLPAHKIRIMKMK